MKPAHPQPVLVSGYCNWCVSTVFTIICQSALSLDSHLHVPHDHLLGSLFLDSRDFCCAACCAFFLVRTNLSQLSPTREFITSFSDLTTRNSCSTPVFFGIDSSLPCQLVGPLFRFLFTCLLSCLSRADSWFRLARDFIFRLHLVARLAIFHFVLLLHVSSLCCTFVCSGSKENNCQSLFFVSPHHLHFWPWFCHLRLFLQCHLGEVYSSVACHRSLQHHCIVLCHGVVAGLVPSRGSLPQRGQLFLRTGVSVVSISFFCSISSTAVAVSWFSNTTT